MMCKRYVSRHFVLLKHTLSQLEFISETLANAILSACMAEPQPEHVRNNAVWALGVLALKAGDEN